MSKIATGVFAFAALALAWVWNGGLANASTVAAVGGVLEIGNDLTFAFGGQGPTGPQDRVDFDTGSPILFSSTTAISVTASDLNFSGVSMQNLDGGADPTLSSFSQSVLGGGVVAFVAFFSGMLENTQYALFIDHLGDDEYSGTLRAAVPVPAAVWLLGSGLVGLGLLARRRRQNLAGATTA